jgi:steroid delta-isomerase-like uncharacterized protein
MSSIVVSLKSEIYLYNYVPGTKGWERIMRERLAVVPLIVLLGCVSGCRDREAIAELEAMRAQAQIEEQNRAMVVRWFSTVNRENFGQMFGELFAEDCVQHMPPNAAPIGPEEFKGLVDQFYAAFPEVTHEVVDVIAEGDRVAASVAVHAVHAGEFLGVPASGKELEWTAIAIFRISDGTIKERWEIHDDSAVMRQLGFECRPTG